MFKFQLSRLCFLGAFLLFSFSFVKAQPCDPSVPSFTVNLSGNPDTLWISSDTVRDGQCCTAGNSDNCIEFVLTLDTASVGIIFNVASGAIPTGALYYQVSCGPEVKVGEILCLAGPGPHLITFCKPGNNTNTYSIQAVTSPKGPETTTVRNGCIDTLVAYGFDEPTIIWTSVGPGANGEYNSYLSCQSGCDSTIVSPSGIFPAYVDYEVRGYPPSPCDVTILYIDTVRVYFVTEISVNITPEDAAVCFGQAVATLTATPSGGQVPYRYLWSTGSTASSITVGAGTYTVSLSDETNCPSVYDTVTVGTFSLAISANAGNDTTLCLSSPSIPLNGSVVSARGGLWTGNGGSFTPSDTLLNATYNPTPVELSAGITSLTLTTTGNSGCPSDADIINISFDQLPVVNAGSDQNLCSNTTQIQLNGSVTVGSTTGQWTTSGTGTFSPDNAALNALYIPSVADKQNGAYLILTSTSNGACPAVFDSMQVSFVQLATVNAGPDQTICSNASDAVLSGTVTGGTTTGIWSTNGTGIFSPNDSTLNASYSITNADSIAGSVIIVLTSTNNSPCPPVKDTVQITIGALTIVNAGNDQNLCSNTTQIQLNGIVSGGSTTGQWTTSGTGTFSPDNAALNALYIPSVADKQNGAYLILTSTLNGVCPAVFDSMQVSFVQLATVNAGPDQTICSNASDAVLSGTITGGTTTGIWTTNGTGTFSPDNSTLNASCSITNADSAAGSVIILLTSTNNGPCPAVKDSLQITIDPLVVVNAGSDQILCANTTQIQLNGIVSGGSTTGQWTTSGTGTFSPDNAALNALYIPSAADIQNGISLTLTSTSNGACPVASSTIQISFIELATADAGPDQTICSSASNVALVGIIDGGSSTGIWSTNGTGVFSPTDTTLIPSYFITAGDISAGGVVIVLSSTNNGPCPIAKDSLLITIEQSALVNAGPDQIICTNNASVILSGLISGITNTGTWSAIGNGSFSSTNNLNTVYTPSNDDISNGSLKIILTSTNNSQCGAVKDTLNVTITAPPVAEAGTDQLICSNSSAQLNGVVSGGSTTGTWTSLGSGIFSPTANTLNASYNPSGTDLQAGQVRLVLTTTNNGNCLPVSDTIIISFFDISVVMAGADQIICSTNPVVTLQGNITGSATSGVWSSNGTGTFMDPLSINTTYTVSAQDVDADSIRIVLNSIYNGPCPEIFDTLKLEIIDQPRTFLSDTIMCANTLNSIQLTGGLLGDTNTVIWQTSGTGIFSPDNKSNPVLYTPNAEDINNGSLTLTFISTDNSPCIDASSVMTLTLLPKPIAQFTASKYVCFIPNDPISFYNNSVGADFYTWDFGDGLSTEETNPVHNYPETGLYQVTLVAGNNYDCYDSTTATILASGQIIFPTAFTPNTKGGQYSHGDLSNNIFFPYAAGIIDFHMMIFNRWGELVFETFDIKMGWDGYYRDQLCQQDTYVWQAEATFNDGRLFSQKGSVTLLR